MGDQDGDPARTIFPRSLKYQLFTAQEGRCAYCGRLHRVHYLEIDHKYPFSRGGGDETTNLQLLCTPCNMRKGIQSDEEFRYRYRRMLPADGSIPDNPIPQDAFTEETSRTRAAPQVRAIYRRRFAAYRRRSHYRAGRGPGCGLLLAKLAVVTFGLVPLMLML